MNLYEVVHRESFGSFPDSATAQLFAASATRYYVIAESAERVLTMFTPEPEKIKRLDGTVLIDQEEVIRMKKTAKKAAKGSKRC